MYGPHSEACVHSLWNDAGCFDEGYMNPTNLSSYLISSLNNMTLTYVLFCMIYSETLKQGLTWGTCTLWECEPPKQRD